MDFDDHLSSSLTDIAREGRGQRERVGRGSKKNDISLKSSQRIEAKLTMEKVVLFN
jgi:hypothetical protein